MRVRGPRTAFFPLRSSLLSGLTLAAACASANAAETPQDAELPLQIVPQLGLNLSGPLACHPKHDVVLAACWDKLLKLVDARNGRTIRTFAGHERDIYCVAVSPDGGYGLSGGRDEMLRLWELATGRLVWRSRGHSEAVYAVAFSPDSRLAVSGGWDKVMNLWDVASGERVRIFAGHEEPVTSVAFSPDGTLVASASDAVRLWEVETGRNVRTLTGHAGSVYAVAFSPDGKRLLSGGEDGMVIPWDIRSRRRPYGFGSHRRAVRSIAFSRDGRLGASTDYSDKGVVWDAETGRMIKSLKANRHGIAFLSDGRHAASARHRALVVWDMERGWEPRVLRGERCAPRRGDAHVVLDAAFTPDGARALVAGDKLTLWDLRDCRPVWTVESLRGGHLSSVAVSPDGKFAFCGGLGRNVGLYEVESGRLIWSRKGHSGAVMSVAFSPDGSYGLSGGRDFSIRLWDVDSGREVSHFSLPTTAGDCSKVCVDVSPDGRLALLLIRGYALVLWTLEDNRGGRSIDVEADSTYAATFSPDGKSVLTGGSNGLVLWDTEQGTKVRGLADGYEGKITSVAFSPGGKYAVSGSQDNTVRLWDVASGELTRTFEGHGGTVRSVAFSPDGRYLISTGEDRTCRLWCVDTGESVALVTSWGEWMAYTPDGYFGASRYGGRLLSVSRGFRVTPIDQFAVRFNRPDIILRRMGLGSEELTERYHACHRERLRKAGLTERRLADDPHLPEARIIETVQEAEDPAEKGVPGKWDRYVTLTFELGDAKYGLKSYNVYLNDVPVFGVRGKKLAGRKARVTEKLELTGGKNKIEVSCINAVGARSFRDVAHAFRGYPIRGDLYYVGFGVSKYRDARLNLAYAHKDARDLAEIFSRMSGRIRSDQIHTRVYTDGQVTVESISEAKELLRDAKVNDTVVLFVAGHGVHLKDGTYYYLTHDTNVSDLAGTAADFDLIEGLLDGIRPRRKLLLIDTCDSGEVDPDAQRRYFAMAAERGIRARAIRGIEVVAREVGGSATFPGRRDRFIYNDLMRRTGAVVFSSSRGGEFSYESDEIENGLFTEEIISALTSKVADKDGKSGVSTDELRDYVSAAVSRATGGAQNPTVDRDNIYQKFSFPVVKRK